jgi:hypothetical protein
MCPTVMLSSTTREEVLIRETYSIWNKLKQINSRCSKYTWTLLETCADHIYSKQQQLEFSDDVAASAEMAEHCWNLVLSC